MYHFAHNVLFCSVWIPSRILFCPVYHFVPQPILHLPFSPVRPANLENVFRGTFRVKKRDLPAKSGTVGRAHIEIFFRSIQPTEINCIPKYTVERRFGRGTVWYFCEKSNGISVITFNLVICINVGAPRQRYKLRAQKKSDFVQKAGHFHDLAGRGTSVKKAGLSRQKRDGWQVCPVCSRAYYVPFFRWPSNRLSGSICDRWSDPLDKTCFFLSIHD